MKNLFAYTFLILGIYLSSFSQSIPNSGFEDWLTPGSYSNPDSWDSPNAITTAIPIIGAPVVSKGNGGHSGSWSARLENKSFLVYTVPGIITLGKLSIDLANFTFGLSGGVPYNQRPDVFKGFYKYSPQGGDSCAFLALFYKHNNSGGQDTIGVAYYLNDQVKTSWTAFEAPVDWYSTETPDSMNIIVSAAASFSASAGSVLYVDDLSFDYFTAVASPTASDPVRISFNRLTKDIGILLDVPGGHKTLIQVVNLTGQTVKRAETTVNGQKNIFINMADQPKGLYLVEVSAGDVKVVKKVVVN